ncbi:MAG: alpha-L-fucosidase [Ginsengibacter sp.]
MKKHLRVLGLVAILIVLFGYCALAQKKTQIIPVPNKQQLAWQQAEFGVVFHYDLHVFDSSKYVQAENRITPIADYNIFNPEKLNVEQWVMAAKNAGAKFALITVTHETGFALYQSDVNPYSMKALKWKEGKGDLVRDFVAACRKHNIKPGIYLGIRWNSFMGVRDFKVEGEGGIQMNRQIYYNKMVEGMLTELCTRYGPLFEIWFDGGASSPDKGAPDVLPIVKKYQPDCLFYHNDQLAEARWGGSESGTVGYPCWSTFPYAITGSGESAIKGISNDNFSLLKHGDSLGKYWMPAMADAPLRGYNGRHEWFWEPGDDSHIEPLENLVNMYYKSVGRNATLVLGLTPDNAGLIPQSDVDRLKEFGTAIKEIFDNPLASVHGSGKILIMRFKETQNVNQISLGEDISKGERIMKYSIEALIERKWKLVCEGTSVGNKRIQKFAAIKTKSLKLVIREAKDTPDILFFHSYFVTH